MAYLNHPTGFVRTGEGLIQLGLYGAYSSNWGASYIHMKTDIALSTYLMIMLEAVGAVHGSPKLGWCSWNFYTYSYLVSNTQTSSWSGFQAHGVYVAADNYIVIRMYAPTYTKLGFVLNSYNAAGTGRGQPVVITAVTATTNSGSYY